MLDETYYPLPQKEGGWRVGDPESLGVDVDKLNDAVNFHNNAVFTESYGGALVIIYKGHIILPEEFSLEQPISISLGQRTIEAKFQP